ncbi:MAG: hypothetical protein WDN49_09605 [Acetobacteraceae bacterium]
MTGAMDFGAALSASAWLVGLASLGGLALLMLLRAVKPRGAVWLPGVAHGLLGLAGLGALLLGLRGPVRGVEAGAGSFGLVAAVLLGGAAAVGLAIFIMRLWRRAPSTLVLGIHATFAVAGFVMLAAYLSA